MIATQAFLIVPGDRIRHRGADYTVTGASAVLDETNPRICLLVTTGRRRYSINLHQSDYIARLEGSPS